MPLFIFATVLYSLFFYLVFFVDTFELVRPAAGHEGPPHGTTVAIARPTGH